MIRGFNELSRHLALGGERKRLAVVCGEDRSTVMAVARAARTETGFARAVFVGNAANTQRMLAEVGGGQIEAEYIDVTDPVEAAQKAVALVREGGADVLMKGLVGTDVLLRAVLDKQLGILPPGAVLTHLAVTEWPSYGKLLVFSDAAVIPYPTPEQRRAQVGYAADLCRALGVDEPRISLIHCSEKASEKFPHTLDYAAVVAEARAGRWGNVLVDGPLDVRTSCDAGALRVKGIPSPLEGQADALIFPDIEAGNTFYKAMTYFAASVTAGILKGTTHPVVLPSRGDSDTTKYYSLALASL